MSQTRIIKFRGYCPQLESWFYGNLVQNQDKYFISVPSDSEFGNFVQVDPKSVGQFIFHESDLKTDLYEGDIIKIKGIEKNQGKSEADFIYVLKYTGLAFSPYFKMRDIEIDEDLDDDLEWIANDDRITDSDKQYLTYNWLYGLNKIEVIGSCFLNPELLNN